MYERDLSSTAESPANPYTEPMFPQADDLTITRQHLPKDALEPASTDRVLIVAADSRGRGGEESRAGSGEANPGPAAEQPHEGGPGEPRRDAGGGGRGNEPPSPPNPPSGEIPEPDEGDERPLSGLPGSSDSIEADLPPDDPEARRAYFQAMSRGMLGIVVTSGPGEPVGQTETEIAREREAAAEALRRVVLGPETDRADAAADEAGQERLVPSGFLSAIPHEVIQGVGRLRTQLTSEAITQEMSAEEIADRLRNDPTLAAAYPDRAVPEQFRQERPAVRFTPTPIDERSLHIVQGEVMAGRAMEYVYASGLADTAITTPEQLADWMVRIRDELEGHLLAPGVSTLMDDAFRGYLHNMDLHRLVKDPNGAVVRYSRTPALDGATRPIEATLANNSEGFNSRVHAGTLPHLINPTLRQQAAQTWLTTWYRQEPSAALLEQSRLPGRKRMESTVGELERSNTLALDGSAGMSLLALRNTYTP